MHKDNTLISLVAIVGIVSLFALLVMPGSGNLAAPLVGIGQTLGEKLPSISGPSQDITGSRRTSYSQSIVFSRQDLFDGGKVEFVQDDLGNVQDAMVFSDDILLYTLDFEEGLFSRREGRNLRRLWYKPLNILGWEFNISNATYRSGSNELRIQLQGPQHIDWTDVVDDSFSRGVRLDGYSADALVRMRAIITDDDVTIQSIEYLIEARPAQGTDVIVPAGQSVQEYIRNPAVFLVPDLDLRYKGVGVAKDPPIVFSPVSRGYNLEFTNQQGRRYRIPLIYNDGGTLKYGKGTRTLHASEGGTIAPGDYIVLTSSDTTSGITKIFQYRSKRGTSVTFQDMAGGQKIAPISNNQGFLRAYGQEFTFTVSGDNIQMDLNRDGVIGSATMPIVIQGGTKLDLGTAGATATMTYTAPPKFSENRVTESITFTFSTNGRRVTVDTNLATFRDRAGYDVGMMNAGSTILINRNRQPSKVEIFATAQQAKASITVG